MQLSFVKVDDFALAKTLLQELEFLDNLILSTESDKKERSVITPLYHQKLQDSNINGKEEALESVKAPVAITPTFDKLVKEQADKLIDSETQDGLDNGKNRVEQQI